MKLHTLFLSVALAVTGLLSLNACATKERAIGQLEDLSDDLRDHGADYTVADWKHAARRFVKVRKRIERHHLTADDRRRIGRLEGQCARSLYKEAKAGLTDGLFGIGSELQGILESLDRLFDKDDAGTGL